MDLNNIKKKTVPENLNGYILLLALVLFAFSRIIFIFYNFWGLEYEDSYIYYDNALNIENKLFNKGNVLQCISCDIGSYKDCFSYMSYGAHYKTFSYAIFAFNKIFGTAYQNIFIVNFLISICILIIFYLFVKDKMTRIIFTLCIAITPFYALFSTSGNSEIFSSLFVLSSLFCSYNLIIRKKQSYIYLFILCATIAAISNRENFVLFFIFILLHLLSSERNNLKTLIKILAILIYTAFLLYLVGVFDTEMEYANDIQNQTFSLKYLLDNSTAFLGAFTSLELWGITGYLFITSVFTFIFFRKKSKINLYLIIFFVSYYLLTFLHYRHYHYLLTGEVSPFETLRYTSTFFPLIAAFISFNLSYLFKKYNNKFSIICISITVIFMTFKTFETRRDFSNDEYYSRTKPAEEILKYYKAGDIIVTNFPIVIKNIANQNTMIADLRSLEKININSFNTIYLLLNSTEYNEIKETYKIKKLRAVNDYEIYVIQN